MGRALIEETLDTPGVELTVACDHSDHPAIGQDAGRYAGRADCGVKLTDELANAINADVVIDFSAPAVTSELIELCAKHGVPLVSGTTGLEQSHHQALNAAAERIALLWAPNMSVGVSLLCQLVAQATLVLGDEYDIEIVETHHRHKKDAPSGTALRLADVAAQASGGQLDQRLQHGRQGLQPRQSREIGIHAVRGGDVVGDHTVLFACEGERIELVHRASSRRTFSRGAVRAATWLIGRPCGRYQMQDVLSLPTR